MAQLLFPKIAVYFGPPRIMALSVFPNCRLFRLTRISRNYFSPDRRLFRLAYVSWHYRYFHITVYFGSAKVSRHRYSSRIIKYLIVVAYDSSATFHGYSAISGSEATSYPYLNSMNRTISSSRIHLGSVTRAIPRLAEKSQFIVWRMPRKAESIQPDRKSVV